MNQDPRQVILQVLEVINYEDDKNKFANEFVALCFQKALVVLSQELPQDKQDQVAQRLSLVSGEQIEPLILEYFPQEKLDQAVREASASTFEEYIKTIMPILDDNQKNKLQNFLSSSNPTS